VIGFLTPGASPDDPVIRSSLAAFRHGLSETGYVEGQNLAIEYRWADGHFAAPSAGDSARTGQCCGGRWFAKCRVGLASMNWSCCRTASVIIEMRVRSHPVVQPSADCSLRH